ncbi:DUF5011 domain-containing protein [Acholeplasma vituli]|uniref:DUF5011 domain-containing protein n=1 Tax=Paracholeplasma vituli TaxID=69473 RepID=A0ABT2PUU2_9MOLU|nr:DUF5011 domain-containing protein [Paracholeplasma vituli]MCU0104721.1 DUF5011 domain-containing protein [Paracholeplasma vituli]
MKKLLTLVLTIFVSVLSILAITPRINAANVPGWYFMNNKYYLDISSSANGTFNPNLLPPEYSGTIVQLPQGWTSMKLYQSNGTLLQDLVADYVAVPGGDTYVQIDFVGSNFLLYFDYNVSSSYEYSKNASYKLEVEAPNIDNYRPAISGQEEFVTSVDAPKDVNYFKSTLKAIDETDGDITANIYVKTDNYTTNKTVLGRYNIVFGVKDAAQNESTLEVWVTVGDFTQPVINGNSSKVQISYTQTYNISSFKSTLTVSDNYYTLNNSNIVIESDAYTSNKTNLGTYNIVFAVTDGSSNKGTFTKQIEVIDDIAPVFSGPATLIKNNNANLSVSEIKAQLTATDAKEGNKTPQIVVKQDNFTGNGHKVGSYTIIFEVADSKGNTATHTVTVNVSDKLGAVWYIQDGVSIKLVPPATLTRQQMIDLLIATGQINITSQTSFNFVHDEYTGNEETPGVYAMSLMLRDTAGNEDVHSFALVVLEADEGEDTIVIEDPNGSFFEKYQTEIYYVGGALVLMISIFGLVAFYKAQVKASKRNRRRYR